MPKSQHIVDSCTLLFTTSRSTEAPKHNAQIETNRRFLQSPFYDVQVDRGSQTRCPNRDQSSSLAASFLRRPGRQRLPNTTQISHETLDSGTDLWRCLGRQKLKKYRIWMNTPSCFFKLKTFCYSRYINTSRSTGPARKHLYTADT